MDPGWLQRWFGTRMQLSVLAAVTTAALATGAFSEPVMAQATSSCAAVVGDPNTSAPPPGLAEQGFDGNRRLGSCAGRLRRGAFDVATATAGALVPAAMADLAGRLGIEQSRIVVLSADAVDWPNASLGCPEPGRSYSQVVTPGYRIVLQTGGVSYEYHASRTGSPFYCATPVQTATKQR